MCMECEGYTENGHGGGRLRQEVRPQRCKHEFRNGGTNELRLGFPSAVGRAPARRQMYLGLVAAERATHTPHIPHTPAALPDDASTELPFMSNMDEISYWIYTKRAPCLMNYDNLIKKQYEAAHSSKSKPKSVHEVPSPKKKRKRKLSILDDGSASADKQKNVYFDVSQRNNKKIVISSKSDSHGSDIDFNIKNSSIQGKPKRTKLQRNTRTTLHKKNKIVTSTPKVTSLRRSLRQAQQTLNNSHLSISFVFEPGVLNGSSTVKNNISLEQSAAEQLKHSPENIAGGDKFNNKKNTTTNNKIKHNGVNGQFEDLSDMSGFTANYIRSTKVQSNKTSRKLRCKSARNLVKESKPNAPKESSTVLCVNKPAAQQKSAELNFSTDSSQNVINLVTTKDNDKSTKVCKNTSLKFMDTKKNKSTESVNKPKNNVNLNISFQSSTSRYPKRTKATRTITNEQTNGNDRKINNSSEFDNSDRKENSDDKIVSRTRSGRSLGLTLRQPENTVLVLSNSTEQISSMVSVNVASPRALEQVKRKKRVLNRTVRTRRNNQLTQKDSTRDKSGFAACFSDSDNDSEPLQRKFFCT